MGFDKCILALHSFQMQFHVPVDKAKCCDNEIVTAERYRIQKKLVWTRGWPGTVIRIQSSIGGCLRLGGHDDFRGPVQLLDLCFYDLGQTQSRSGLMACSIKGAVTHPAHSGQQGIYHDDSLGFTVSRLLFA